MGRVEVDLALEKLSYGREERDSISVRSDWGRPERFEVLDESELARLGRALATKSGSNVINMSLQGFGLSRSGVSKLAEVAASRGLRQLDLSFCRIGDENITALTTELPHLKTEWLDLTYNALSVSSIPYLSEGLNTRACPIKVLSLRYNPITAYGLGAILTYSPTLLTLDVRCCGIMTEVEEREKGLEAVLKGMKQNRSLNRLLMQGNGFTKEEEAALHNYLSRSPTTGMSMETCLISDPVADPILAKLTGLNESMRSHNKRGVAAVLLHGNGDIPPLDYLVEEIDEHLESIGELESFVPDAPLESPPVIERQDTLPLGWANHGSRGSSSGSCSIDSFDNSMSFCGASTLGIPKVESVVTGGIGPETPRGTQHSRRFMRRRSSDDDMNSMQRVDTLPLQEAAAPFRRSSWGLLESIIRTTPQSTPREIKRKLSIDNSADLLAECTKLIHRIEDKRSDEHEDKAEPSPIQKLASGDLLANKLSSSDLANNLSSSDLANEIALANKMSSSDLLTSITGPPTPTSPVSPTKKKKTPMFSASALKSPRKRTGDHGQPRSPRTPPSNSPPKTKSPRGNSPPKMKNLQGTNSPPKMKNLQGTNSPPKVSLRVSSHARVVSPRRSPRRARSHSPPKEKTYDKPVRRMSSAGAEAAQDAYQPAVVAAFGLSPRDWPVPLGTTNTLAKPIPDSVYSGTLSSTAKRSSKDLGKPAAVGTSTWLASPSMWPEKAHGTVTVVPPTKHAARATEAFSSKTRSRTFEKPKEPKESPIKALGGRGVDACATRTLLDACMASDDDALILLGEQAYYSLFSGNGAAQGVPSLLRSYSGIPSHIASLDSACTSYSWCLAKLLFVISDSGAGAKPLNGAERVIRRVQQQGHSVKKIDFKVAWTVLGQVRWSRPARKRIKT